MRLSLSRHLLVPHKTLSSSSSLLSFPSETKFFSPHPVLFSLLTCSSSRQHLQVTGSIGQYIEHPVSIIKERSLCLDSI